MSEEVEVACVERTAFDTIKYLGVIPTSNENSPNPPSNSEIRRWLDQKSVIINGKKPSSKEMVQWPITQLIFFPKSEKRRTTVI